MDCVNGVTERGFARKEAIASKAGSIPLGLLLAKHKTASGKHGFAEDPNILLHLLLFLPPERHSSNTKPGIRLQETILSLS